MPEHEHEHDKAISELYQQSREETMNTRDLDDKILAAANADLAAERKPTATVVKYSGWRRWSTPVAAAACLLLATSVGFNVMLYQQTQISSEPQAARFADLAVVEPTPVSASAPQVAQTRKKEALTSPQVAAELRERRLSRQESDQIFEVADVESQLDEEVVVTGSALQVDSETETQVEEIIALLENGELKQAEQELAMLIEKLPQP
ncbi:hypothetical protein QSV34_11600 [Porticoccus sp. W117]|uniref:hypothetical protein n=1 Tax=Porticoccus sp. W117 TaxID=3054777 RepID=UPI002595EF66|nr:hypothetical protein [Porticoccus sp. W117]MDM3871991.1 hypothetical protein [Porticoccus sp. W117]